MVLDAGARLKNCYWMVRPKNCSGTGAVVDTDAIYFVGDDAANSTAFSHKFVNPSVSFTFVEGDFGGYPVRIDSYGIETLS